MLSREIPITTIIPITKIQLSQADMKLHMSYIFDQISLLIVIDQRWRHNLCKVMWSITVQTHSNMESICVIW